MFPETVNLPRGAAESKIEVEGRQNSRLRPRRIVNPPVIHELLAMLTIGWVSISMPACVSVPIVMVLCLAALTATEAAL